MNNIQQMTISKPVGCFGVGVHSGDIISMKLSPAAEDTGIIFKRIDLAGTKSEIQANYSSVSNTRLSTTISNQDGTEVATIEHLMAALWGCGIDNVIVEVTGKEVPIMDGSSEPFVFMLECAGVTLQKKKRKMIEILKPVFVSEGMASVSVHPAEHFSVTMDIDFQNTIISKQSCSFDSREVSFKNSLSRARTFGFAHEIDHLRKMGLARGGSLDNAIVVSGDKILNQDGLRYADEFARHKVLDAIGDFSLACASVMGRFHGVCSGHSLNNKLLHQIFADQEAWRFV